MIFFKFGHFSFIFFKNMYFLFVLLYVIKLIKQTTIISNKSQFCKNIGQTIMLATFLGEMVETSPA